MPNEGPFLRQRIGEMLLSIQHNFNDAFNVANSGNRARDGYTQPTRNRRAHLIGIQNLALNLAGFQNVLRQRRQHSFVLAYETQPFHAGQSAAPDDVGHARAPAPVFRDPRKSGPIATLVDVRHSPHVLCR